MNKELILNDTALDMYNTILLIKEAVAKKLMLQNTVPSINMPDELFVTNGSGHLDCIIKYTPENYDVKANVISVESSNPLFTISNVSNSGFTVNVENITTSQSTTIIVVIDIAGKNTVISKRLSAVFRPSSGSNEPEDQDIDTISNAPFIIMNTTDKEVTFGYFIGGSSTSSGYAFETSVMNGHKKGKFDFEDLEYVKTYIGSTWQNVTLLPNESFFIKSNSFVPNSLSYLRFIINTFSPEFDGDVLGTCRNKMVEYACYLMFYNCTSLTKAPKLPATTLADYCYQYMFYGCESLIQAPELPATTLTGSCYDLMFYNCTSLTKAPKLPATTLADYCYSSMFGNCSSLTQAPELPATTLKRSCYFNMFKNCSSLTKAPELPATTLAVYCYHLIFQGCSSLTQAPALPATTLITGCYYLMFSGCTKLTQAPELPVTTLVSYCYSQMFQECTSLTKAPKLPATTLAESCYSGMFYGCTSLTQAPELPATTLAESCYSTMFYGCTSLTKAPELPATTLVSYCYSQMFRDCTSLVQAPELLATTLRSCCYLQMFYGCTKLNYVKMLATYVSAYMCLGSWLSSVPSTGTFVKAASMTSLPSGASGIPSGWTVVNE